MPTKAKGSKTLTKWQKIFTPQITIATILCGVCIIMTVVCFLNPGTKDISITSTVENMTPLDAITPRDRVVQKFTSDNDYTKFGLYYANFSNYLQDGELHIDITSQNETAQFTYKIGGIIDNSFLYVDYPLKKDESYTLTIYISDNAQGITFFTTTADNYDATLTIDKQKEDASIIMAFVTETKDSFAAWYFVMTLVLIMCYIVLKIDKDMYVKEA